MIGQGTFMKDRVYAFLLTVPKGMVVTYGEIARAVGHPRAARAVGNILHSNPDGDRYPCFRVVNRGGKISERYAFGGASEQARRLREEGVEVTEGRVDLERYGYYGS